MESAAPGVARGAFAANFPAVQKGSVGVTGSVANVHKLRPLLVINQRHSAINLAALERTLPDRRQTSGGFTLHQFVPCQWTSSYPRRLGGPLLTQAAISGVSLSRDMITEPVVKPLTLVDLFRSASLGGVRQTGLSGSSLEDSAACNSVRLGMLPPSRLVSADSLAWEFAPFGASASAIFAGANG